jgi:ABC-type branched-subunit amino acid transport system substrate-binding protein
MSTTDFTPLITNILPQKADILHIGVSFPGLCGLIVKQAREMGYDGPIYASTKQDQRAVLEVAGAYADDFYSNSLVPGAPGISEEYNAFYRECMKRHGKWFDVAPTMHRVAYEIKAAIELAGSLDSEKVRDAYKKIGVDSIEGPSFYGPPYGTQAYYPVAMTKIENGKSVLLGLHDPKVFTPEEYHWEPKGKY